MTTSRDESIPNTSDNGRFGKGNYIIRICTFNVNSKINKNQNFDKWLSSENNADILVIGLQELYFKIKDVISPESILSTKVTEPAHHLWIDLLCSLKLIKENYTMLLTKSFAALGLFVFIRTSRIKSKVPPVTHIMIGSFPLGMLGMANKGGLSISFRFNDISLCFVNCHFPAGAENALKRQQSMQAILQKMNFHSNAKSKKINFSDAEFDLIFLFGDLNFRLQNTTAQAVETLAKSGQVNDVNALLEFDELLTLRKTDALYRAFHEAAIRFFPTYKYEVNTNDYNLKRVPSYCDRVLWMGNKCVNISYNCHPEINMSDHQPVSADFFIDGTTISFKCSTNISKTKLSPTVKIEKTTIDFGHVYFLTNHYSNNKIENIGSLKCEVTFKTIRSYLSARTWFTVVPQSFVLEPKASQVVQFRIYIDSDNVAYFNSNQETINCTVVYLSVFNGVNTAIQFKGEYHLSLFGISLDYFQFIHRPVGHYKPSDIEAFSKSKSSKGFIVLTKQELLSRVFDLLMPYFTIDKKFSDIILTQSGDVNSLRLLTTTISNVDIRQPVPKTKPVNYIPGVYIEALLIFIKSLPQHIIPFVIQARLAANSNNRAHVLKILHNLPKPNIFLIRRMTRYLHSFVKTVEDVEFIANVVVACIPPSSPSLKEHLVHVLSFLIQRPSML